jgi:hypothetical protein
MLMKGSVGTSLVMLSARSGISEKAAIALTVEATEVMMDEVRAYRRRDVRSRKKVFQSSGEAPLLLGGAAVVDAWRVRHRDGVKKEEEEDVLMEGGGFVAVVASLTDARRCRFRGMSTAEEMCRRGDVDETVFEVRRIGRDGLSCRPSLVVVLDDIWTPADAIDGGMAETKKKKKTLQPKRSAGVSTVSEA